MQLTRSKTYNRYDICLFLIIISALYGRYGFIHPSSFLSIWFFPELIKNKNLLFSRRIKSVSAFLLLWVLYAAISFSWVPNMHDAILEFSLLLFNSLLFMEIVVFSMKANRPLQTLALAWTCAFLITSVVAVWEINTDHHLLSAKELKEYRSNGLGDYMEKNSAIFTFYNPNTYIYYICIVFPFALYLFFQAKRTVEKFRYLIPILLAVYVASQNSSRGGILAMAVMLCSFIYYKMKDDDNQETFEDIPPVEKKSSNHNLLLPNICYSSVLNMPIQLYMPFINDAYYYTEDFDDIGPHQYSSLQKPNYRDLF